MPGTFESPTPLYVPHHGKRRGEKHTLHAPTPRCSSIPSYLRRDRTQSYLQASYICNNSAPNTFCLVARTARLQTPSFCTGRWAVGWLTPQIARRCQIIPLPTCSLRSSQMVLPEHAHTYSKSGVVITNSNNDDNTNGIPEQRRQWRSSLEKRRYASLIPSPCTYRAAGQFARTVFSFSHIPALLAMTPQSVSGSSVANPLSFFETTKLLPINSQILTGRVRKTLPEPVSSTSSPPNRPQGSPFSAHIPPVDAAP